MILEWLGLGVTVFTQNAAENIGAENPGKKTKTTKQTKKPLILYRCVCLCSAYVLEKRHYYLTDTVKDA